MKIKCIITDDEPIARKGLRGYIEKVDFLTLTGECEDAVQLNTILKTQEIDLLFLDIEMPEMTGIELLSNLTNPPKVIIVSAYDGVNGGWPYFVSYCKEAGNFSAAQNHEL